MKICLPTTKVWRRASRVEMYYLTLPRFQRAESSATCSLFGFFSTEPFTFFSQQQIKISTLCQSANDSVAGFFSVCRVYKGQVVMYLGTSCDSCLPITQGMTCISGFIPCLGIVQGFSENNVLDITIFFGNISLIKCQSRPKSLKFIAEGGDMVLPEIKACL